jgi:hypothetical protein
MTTSTAISGIRITFKAFRMTLITDFGIIISLRRTLGVALKQIKEKKIIFFNFYLKKNNHFKIFFSFKIYIYIFLSNIIYLIKYYKILIKRISLLRTRKTISIERSKTRTTR